MDSSSSDLLHTFQSFLRKMAGKLLCFLLLVTILELLEGSASENLNKIRRKKRIIFGDDTTIDEMPYMALLRQNFDDVPICGGTIITPSRILTAAHCFWIPDDDSDKSRDYELPSDYEDPAQQTEEASGSWKNPGDFEFVIGTANSNGAGGQLYQLEEVYVSRDFNCNTLQSDIAVVKLHGVILFDYSTIAPARLPFREVKYNVKALIGGCGDNEMHEIPKKLQKLEVTTVERSECQETYGLNILTRKDSMCAHKNDNIGYGVCKGDSGGGLVKDNVVFGVLSNIFGPDCGCFVDGYTIVWYHLEWILFVLFDEIPANVCILSIPSDQAFG